MRAADAAGADAVAAHRRQRRPLQPQVRPRHRRQPVPPAGRHRRRRSPAPCTRCAAAGLRRARRRRRGQRTSTRHDVGPRRRPHRLGLRQRGWGLDRRSAGLADEVVRVPIHGRAESLNLATAAAVCLYASAHRAQRSSPRQTSGQSRAYGGGRQDTRVARRWTPCGWRPATSYDVHPDGLRRRRRATGPSCYVNRAAGRASPASPPSELVGNDLARRSCRCRTSTARWWACTDPYGGLAIRTGQPRAAAVHPRRPRGAGHRPLRPRPGRSGRSPGSSSPCATPRPAAAPSAAAPSWSPRSPTSCARR